MANFKFKENYDATTSIRTDSNGAMAMQTLKYSFKKGDVFEGEKFIQSVGVRTGSTPIYGVKINTPEALKVDGTKWSGQAIFEVPDNLVEVTEEGLSQNNDETADSGLNTNVLSQTFIQKHKNHLLIAGALVLGYFAYKKFNK